MVHWASFRAKSADKMMQIRSPLKLRSFQTTRSSHKLFLLIITIRNNWNVFFSQSTIRKTRFLYDCASYRAFASKSLSSSPWAYEASLLSVHRQTFDASAGSEGEFEKQTSLSLLFHFLRPVTRALSTLRNISPLFTSDRVCSNIYQYECYMKVDPALVCAGPLHY